MLKRRKTPSHIDLYDWLKKANTKNPDGLKWDGSIDIQYPNGETPVTVPKGFVRYWTFIKNTPVVLNVIGLALMIIPILLV